MVTTYILVLTLSAWMMAFGLSFVAGRLTHATALPFGHAHGLIALVVSIGFLVAAAAPGWVMVVALILIAVPPIRTFPTLLPWAVLPLALLPLIVTPLIGAPSWVALDSALIASSILGAVQARGVAAALGRALLPFVWLVGWLAFTALMHVSGQYAA